MPLTIKEQYEQIRNKKLLDSNKLQYNIEICKIIKRNIARINLPKLTNDEMSQLKEHLAEYKKIPNEELPYKFLNLYNSFTLIYKFEENIKLRGKIQPIIAYLKEYEHIINLIIESQGKKETPILDKAMIILHLEINMFCMQYAFMLTDIDTTQQNYTPITPPNENNEEDDDLITIDDIPNAEDNPFEQYEDEQQ